MLVLLLISSVVWAQPSDKVFFAVDVVGLKRLVKEDLVALLEPFMGKPFGPQQKKQMQEMFMDVSFFRSVVIKEGKNQTLELYIQERLPMFRFQQQAIFMDVDGQWFEPFGSWADEAAIPALLYPATAPEEMSMAHKQQAIDIASHPHIQRHRLASLKWEPNTGWVLVLQELPVPIKLGKRELSERMSRLEKAFEKILLQKEKIHGVNLQFHGRVILELKPLS